MKRQPSSPPIEDEYLERAMLLTGNFEGDDPWANITGNSDGEGLTCGQIGKTIKSGDQQDLMKEYLAAHGANELRALMPKTGAEYLRAITASIREGMEIVKPWSNGSAKVRQPYAGELAAFWKCANMVGQQKAHAKEHEGKLVRPWIADWQGTGSFREYALFFDVAAQDGDMAGVGRVDVDAFIGNDLPGAFKKALTWTASAPDGQIGNDSRKNVRLWETLLPAASVAIGRLFILAHLRAKKARPKYRWDVMNRKGSIAVGQGWIHGEKWTFKEDFGLKKASARTAKAKSVVRTGQRTRQRREVASNQTLPLGFCLRLQRRRQEQRPGIQFSRTVSDYQCFWNQAPIDALSGQMVERGGPGDNGSVGASKHRRIREGTYPLAIAETNHYETYGYEEDHLLPGLLLTNTGARQWILLHPCHDVEYHYLSSTGCLNPARGLQNASSLVDLADSKKQVIAVIETMKKLFGQAFPRHGVIHDAAVLIEGEPA